MNTLAPKKKGDKSNMQVMTACVMQDWVVLEPIGDCDRYDFVINRGNGFERVQSKTGKYYARAGSIIFPTCSTNHYVRQGDVIHSKKKSYKGEADLFGVYCFDTDQVYLIPVEDCGDTACNLRVDPIKSGQHKGVKWAKDYILGGIT